MGTVYLAERADGEYEQRVALKVMQEGVFSPGLVDRFRQERQILARLSHPGIARLVDGGLTPDGRPYLVLEYVAGIPIDRYCEEEGLDTAAKLRLFLKVAEAVQSAHQQLVLHLDLKPANILVTASGDPRLLDFGISRILSEGGSGSRHVEATLRLLTPSFASPEQIEGAPLGVASDVFSLATLLYRLLTGTSPYPIEGASPLEAARMIRETPPVAPSRSTAAGRPELRGDLDTILLKALRKEPERRYATVAAFAEDIERHLASRPVLAHADSFRYRGGKFLRRRRVGVIAAAAMFLILAASGAAVVRSAIVAREQRAAAERRLKDVRALAHSYIFDLDPQLEQIPGTVGVRNFILKNGLVYLEAMSRESNGDDDLSREVAAGYNRIGRIQADPAMPSLGDSTAAWISMKRGIEIEQRLFDKNPADLKERSTLIQQMRHVEAVAEFDGDIALFDKMARRAWELSQPMLAAGPSHRGFLNIDGIAWDIANANCGNGDLWNFADPAAALPWLDRQHEILERYKAAHPDELSNPSLAGGYEREYITRGQVLLALGRGTEARPFYEEALRLTATKTNDVIEDQARKIIRGDYAAYLLAMHDVKGASAMARDLEAGGTESAGKPRALTGDEADSLSVFARIDLEGGHVSMGKGKMKQALEVLESLHKANPQDAEVSAELAWDTYRFAEETVLDSATRQQLYGRASEIAAIYAGSHLEVLSAAMLVGRCNLGLAEMARAAHRMEEQQTLATASAAQFAKVLAAHPVQPEADALLRRARALTTS